MTSKSVLEEAATVKRSRRKESAKRSEMIVRKSLILLFYRLQPSLAGRN
jgi:hypothetical protein